MKKILLGLLTLGIANLCNAQKVDKKEEVKFVPPVIKKDKQTTKATKTTKFAPPVIKKDKEVKFPPPVVTKKETTKFKPPVIVKDEETKFPPPEKKNKAKEKEKEKFAPPTIKDQTGS